MPANGGQSGVISLAISSHARAKNFPKVKKKFGSCCCCRRPGGGRVAAAQKSGAAAAGPRVPGLIRSLTYDSTVEGA